MNIKKLRPFLSLGLICSIVGCSNNLTIPYRENKALALKEANEKALREAEGHEAASKGDKTAPDPTKTPALPPEDPSDKCADFKAKLPTGWKQKVLSVLEDPNDQKSAKINIFYYTNYDPKSASTPVVFINDGTMSSSHFAFAELMKTVNSKTVTQAEIAAIADDASADTKTQPAKATPAKAPKASSSHKKRLSSTRTKTTSPKSDQETTPAQDTTMETESLKDLTLAPSSEEKAKSMALSQAAQSLSWVFFDTRGNGCSDPYPQLLNPNPLDPSNLPILIRMSNYGSSAIVADLEAIRADLFTDKNKKWSVYGAGSGGMIAQRYVELKPESLKSVHVFSNALVSDPLTQMKNKIKAQDLNLKNFLAAYPEAESRLETLSKNLVPTQCYKDTTNTAQGDVCGHGVLAIMANTLLSRADRWAEMEKRLKDMADLNATPVLKEAPIRDFLNSYHFKWNIPLKGNTKWVANFLLDWTDRYIMNPDAYNCEKAKAALTAEGYDEKYLMNECSTVVYADIQAPSPATQSPLELYRNQLPHLEIKASAIASSLIANQGINFYWYLASISADASPSDALEEKSALSGVGTNLKGPVVFEGKGKEAFATEAQIWNDLVKEISR